MEKRLDWISFALLGALIIYTGMNVRWVYEYRDGLHDIDESGYLLTAFRHYAAMSGGLWPWLQSVFEPSPLSPLGPGVGSLFLRIFGPIEVNGFLMPVFFGALSVIATYFIGKTLGGRLAGAASATLLATTPLILVYSRSFQFSMPATAITALALLSLLKSKRASSWGWTLAFGVFVGLMPLARTVTTAFVPCLAAAALLLVMFEADRFARLGRLVIAAVVAAAVSSTWLWSSWQPVWRYLTDFGYGSRATEFGERSNFVGSFLIQLRIMLDQLYAPHSVLLVCATVLGVSYLVFSFRTSLVVVLRSEAFAAGAFFTLCVLVLSTSQNKGTGFIAPALPAAYALCGVGVARARRAWVKAAGIASVLIVSSLAAAPFIDLESPLAVPIVVSTDIGRVYVTSGAGSQENYEAGNGVNTATPFRALPSELSKGWKDLNAQTAQRLAGKQTALGFRNVVYNVNSLRLETFLQTGHDVQMYQIEPVAVGEGLAAYKEWLDGPAAKACNLLTSGGEQAEFRPTVETTTLEDAAQQSGFSKADQWPMPSGRTVTLWQRPC